MARLVNAPVVYVLAILRFPRLAEPEKLVAALQPRLRKTYPLMEEVTVPQVRVDVSNEGLQVLHEDVKLWQFATTDKKWSVVVNAGLIGLHTVDYEDHADFFAKFAECAAAATGIADVGIELIETLALRYVDLIVPQDGDRLEDYLAPGMLPTDMPGVSDVHLEDGVHAAKYRTSKGTLRLQVLRKPPTVLPPELSTPITAKNGWGANKPGGDFAVLDFDHSVRFSPPAAVDTIDIKAHMSELRDPIRTMFEAAATPHAMRVWKGEV